MLERLKSAGEYIKYAFLSVVMPVAFIVGVIWYLMTKNHDLKDELNVKKSEDKLNEIEGEKKQVDTLGNAAVDQYTREKREYDRIAGSPGPDV